MGADPDILVDLTTAASVTEAEITALTLRAAGVPAHVMANAGVSLPWDLGSSGAYRIAVRRGDIGHAQDALRDAKADSAASIDWDHLDVGQLEPGEALAAAAPTLPAARARKRRISRAIIVFAVVGPGLAFTLGSHWRYALAALVLVGLLWIVLGWAGRRSHD